MDENIFRRFKLRLESVFKKSEKRIKETSGDESSSPTGADGKIFTLWSWGLPVLLGLTAGWFGMICLEVWLDGRNGRNRSFAAVPRMTASAQEMDSDNMAAFLRTNPFGITPMAAPEITEPDEPDDEAPPIVGSLATAILKGTSPRHMAWLEDQGVLRLIMLGDSFDVYTLEDVTHLDATFVRGEERVVKMINFGNRTVAASPPVQPRQSPRGTRADAGQVMPPDPGRGTPGVIGRERVNQLLENPFDELRNIRLRPPENGQGLRIEWINNNSIFAQLGVQQDDVIQGINGIVFRNAADLTNAMSSLMASDQFAVEVMRNGAPTLLHYEVR